MLEYLSIEDQNGFKLLARLFEHHGHDIRLVGGAVRDMIQDDVPHDLDFCSTATPNEMLSWKLSPVVKIIPTGIDHGTVTFVTPFGNYEVTTLRTDVDCDGRHAKVAFTKEWTEDASRRDFTFNALMVTPDGMLFDYFDGVSDLQNKVVRFIGSADDRIQEDGLRILRYFRFIVKINSDKHLLGTLQAIERNIDVLDKVSRERIWDEIKKIIKLDVEQAGSAFLQMKNLGVAQKIGLPVASERRARRIDTLERWANVFPTFVLGALCQTPKQAQRLADNWKLSNAERAELMFFAENRSTELNTEQVQDWIMEGVSKEWIRAMCGWKQKKSLEKYVNLLKFQEFPMKGQDLLDMGMKPGPEIGQKLADLKQQWKNSRYTLTKAELINSFLTSFDV